MNPNPRAKFWAMFAAAAITRQMNAKAAAAEADDLLKEFDKRWEWYEGGYGQFWKLRDKPLKEKGNHDG
jgi:hypothetical protein